MLDQALQLEAAFVEQGKREGRAHAAKAAFRNGQLLGIAKGYELVMLAASAGEFAATLQRLTEARGSQRLSTALQQLRDTAAAFQRANTDGIDLAAAHQRLRARVRQAASLAGLDAASAHALLDRLAGCATPAPRAAAAPAMSI